MILFNGLVNVDVMATFPTVSDIALKVAEAVNDNDVNLGEFGERYESIMEEVGDEVAAEQEPVVLNAEDQNFLCGLALMLGVKF